MLRLHTFSRKFAASIAVLLAVVPVLHSGHVAIGVAEANSSSIEQHVASPAPLQAQAQSEGGILQSVLDLMARRSLAAAGWTVSSVAGAIDNASLRPTESDITG